MGPCLVPSCLMGSHETTSLRCMPDWQEVLSHVSRESGAVMCVNVEGAGRRGRLVFGVDVFARNPKPRPHMLCRHVGVSFEDEHPCRGAARDALRSASHLLKVRATTMLLEMTRVPQRVLFWKPSPILTWIRMS